MRICSACSDRRARRGPSRLTCSRRFLVARTRVGCRLNFLPRQSMPRPQQSCCCLTTRSDPAKSPMVCSVFSLWKLCSHSHASSAYLLPGSYVVSTDSQPDVRSLESRRPSSAPMLGLRQHLAGDFRARPQRELASDLHYPRPCAGLECNAGRVNQVTISEYVPSLTTSAQRGVVNAGKCLPLCGLCLEIRLS